MRENYKNHSFFIARRKANVERRRLEAEQRKEREKIRRAEQRVLEAKQRRESEPKKRRDKKLKRKGKLREEYLIFSAASEFSLLINYGITIEQYKKLFKIQKGCCAICGRNQLVFKNRLHVDHDHKTNKIRGLLCPGCNNGLGIYEKNKNRYRRYLQKDKLL